MPQMLELLIRYSLIYCNLERFIKMNEKFPTVYQSQSTASHSDLDEPFPPMTLAKNNDLGPTVYQPRPSLQLEPDTVPPENENIDLYEYPTTPLQNDNRDLDDSPMAPQSYSSDEHIESADSEIDRVGIYLEESRDIRTELRHRVDEARKGESHLRDRQELEQQQYFADRWTISA